MASPKMDYVSEALAVSTAEKGIAGSSAQYTTRAEPERAFDELKTSEDKFRVMVDAIPTLAWCSLADGSVEFFNQRCMTTRASRRSRHTAGDGKSQFIPKT
jgi:hypothetical protein